MTVLSKSEIEVLGGIAFHEYGVSQGKYPTSVEEVGTYLWVSDFSETLSVEEIEETLESLVEKSLINIYDLSEESGKGVDFTQAGYDAFVEYY
jgi:hypothetical protein